jgi:hypothetical protein
MEKIKKINEVGQHVFYNPSPLLTYDKLVKKALNHNTYRGFHKIDKTKSGAKVAFEKVLTDNSKFVIDSLLAAKNEADIDKLENEICKMLKDELEENIKNDQLKSFNKLRKPVDIFIEHVVAMLENFTIVRKTITPYLFLPLDSQMFKSDFVFSDDEITKLNLKRNFTFKDIETQEQYLEIQNFLKEKANKCGIDNRIFFDLVWNDRWKSKGNNLFETNP